MCLHQITRPGTFLDDFPKRWVYEGGCEIKAHKFLVSLTQVLLILYYIIILLISFFSHFFAYKGWTKKCTVIFLKRTYHYYTSKCFNCIVCTMVIQVLYTLVYTTPIENVAKLRNLTITSFKVIWNTPGIEICGGHFQ